MANDLSTNAGAGAPPTVAFDPNVSFSSPTRARLTGTVSDSAGVKGVELFNGTTDLGAAKVHADGTWSFSARLGPGLYDGLTAVATGQDGQTASAASPYTLTTGIKDQPYTAEQASFDPTGEAVGNTYFGPLGAVYLSDSIATTRPHGGTAVTYSGGDFFDGKAYSSFTDFYGPQGLLTKHIEHNNDGTHTVTGFQNGLIFTSFRNDTILGGGSSESFVFSTYYGFTPSFGNDTILDFQVGGVGHDTLVLPISASTHLAEIIREADTMNGNTTLHLDPKNSITLQGVTAAELVAHPNDIRFPA